MTSELVDNELTAAIEDTQRQMAKLETEVRTLTEDYESCVAARAIMRQRALVGQEEPTDDR